MARRWPAGGPTDVNRGLCGTRDSADKSIAILQRLDILQGWFEQETCPDEYPTIMGELYGDCPTHAGQEIRKWFIQLFDEDQARVQEARQELPKWIAKEKTDVEQDRELHRREMALRRYDGPATTEDEVAAKEARLERQIVEQTRLLLQLKSKRFPWGPAPETGEAGGSETQPVESLSGSGTDSTRKNPEGGGGRPVPPVPSPQHAVTKSLLLNNSSIVSCHGLSYWQDGCHGWN
jgi:hypothetical protein